MLDRANGQFLGASPFVHALTWASGISKDGRPVLPARQRADPGRRARMSVDGRRHQLDVHGFRSGAPAVLSDGARKVQRLLEILRRCGRLANRITAAAPAKSRGETPRQYLRALDLETGKIAWEIPQTGDEESWGGVLATATGLLFYCDDSGAFAAVDAATGAPLWHMQLNTAWKASPMTYTAKGRQYVAVAAGGNLVSFGLPE